MVLIEMCGCPGCGKSTLMEEVIKILLQEGKSVLTEKELHKNSKISSLLSKCGLLFSLSNVRLKMRLFSYWASCGFGLHSFRYVIRVLEVDKYVRSGYNTDFLFLDEGAIQHLTSVSHEKKVVISKELTNLVFQRLYCKNAIVLNCTLPFDRNVERLLKRQRKGDRFIKVSDQETIEALKIKKNNIESVLDAMQIETLYQIDTSDLESAVNKVISVLISNSNSGGY